MTVPMKPPRDIALFGGSFDPPHLGHVAIIAHVLATEPVDEVWALPCFQHPFGKRTAPFALRLRMLEEALAPFATRARVEDIEASLGGVSYTIDTVRGALLLRGRRGSPGRAAQMEGARGPDGAAPLD
jgi:nicotinate-nucleotide adenylyltransferase